LLKRFFSVKIRTRASRVGASSPVVSSARFVVTCGGLDVAGFFGERTHSSQGHAHSGGVAGFRDQRQCGLFRLGRFAPFLARLEEFALRFDRLEILGVDLRRLLEKFEASLSSERRWRVMPRRK